MSVSALALAALSAPAAAQQAAGAAVEAFALPEQDATDALDSFVRQTRLTLVYTADLVRGVRTKAVRGRMAPRAALDAMLEGTGLVVVEASGGLTIRRAQSAEDADAPPAQDVVVTGSRLRRSPLDTPTPVLTVGREDLDASGEIELAEALAEFPAISSDLNGGTVTGNVQNSGLDVVALRNLGNNRTLVLIDGRRTVSNSGIGNLVSLNTIPTDFVERVEVITGGASSVYGSDAVAGVVNIITETGRTGFRLGARTGISDRGDARELTFNASWGTRFAGDRGYLYLSGTYDRDYGLRAVNREFATREFQYRYTAGVNEIDSLFINPGSGTNTNVPTSGFRPASTFPPNVARDLSSLIPGGVFWGQSSARDRFYTANGLVPLGPDVQTGVAVPTGTSDDGNAGYFLPNRDGYNQRTGRDLQIPRERYLAAGKASFELSDAVTLFAQGQYSRINTLETREPVGLAFDDAFLEIDPVTGLGTEVTIGRIPCRRASGAGAGPCSPFVPAEIRADVSTTGAGGVAFQRRFVEVGDQIYENERETIRSWAGLRADLGGGWNLEASVGYGRYDQFQLRRNGVIIRRLQAGLNAEVGPDGQPRCVDAAARAAGCVPVNLFGIGSISTAAADYLRADVRQDLTVEQLTGQAFVTGPLAQLPAGPLSIAAGVDYRRDRQDLRGDAFARLGGTTENVVPDFSGSIRAVEGFAEVSVPILADRPGAELLTLDASGRVADYSVERIGTVLSYRAGLQYAPIRDLRIRAQFARSQRAPDLSELYSPPRGDFDTVVDICDGVRPTTTGTIAANCRAEPGIQAAFAQQAAAGQLQEFDAVTSIYSPNAGNRGLKEETADTLTIGAVLQPRFLPGLTLSVDYYSIKIDDAIDSYTNEDLLRLCYDSAGGRAGNPFCADISRNANNGQLSQIIQREVNVAGYDVEGVDVAADLRFSLRDLGVPGRWQVKYAATHLLKQDFSFVGLNGVETADRLGELISRTFKYRARGSLEYKLDGLTLRYTATYFGQIRDSNTRRNAYQALLATNPAAEYPLFLSIGDVWEHDVYAGVDVKPGFRFYAGVNNLLDQVSPFLPTGTTSGRLTNLNTAYDLVGRRFYAGVRIDF